MLELCKNAPTKLSPSLRSHWGHLIHWPRFSKLTNSSLFPFDRSNYFHFLFASYTIPQSSTYPVTSFRCSVYNTVAAALDIVSSFEFTARQQTFEWLIKEADCTSSFLFSFLTRILLQIIPLLLPFDITATSPYHIFDSNLGGKKNYNLYRIYGNTLIVE